ncbi:hypothetical protein BDV95DRAFT_495285 [Massariosphaeria phaeospora]|uniref:Uncharacterized protein n=1 Tax=Massariosphaeria phaeospora TaxID=100035 RepID=A0A7C8M5H9_9PLEO|nr:hypothetical protein BDV95DRAFT_495285 [Massariosphaeria phaeospora]
MDSAVIHHELDAKDSNLDSAIAICGMALRLPSGVRTPQQLWQFLIDKGDARSLVPESRYNVSAFYDPSDKPARVNTEYGYFLGEDISALDTSFFSMARSEVERVDPQQRLMLEVARECFEDAGEDWRAKTIGCYMGSLEDDWLEMTVRETQNWGQYRLTGYADFALSNRISYEFNLKGPSMTIRTACSSSIICLHEACNAILHGDCDSALVGGVNLILTPGGTMGMVDQQLLSPDGSCKTFSRDANGYARGEGITAIYVKKLSDALRDGNPIRGVIRATAANHDGKTQGMGLPSSEAQEAMIRRAYERAGIEDVAKTGFIECHGTGTQAGDRIETTAVDRVFGPSGIHIGSIKPAFGHTEGAAGILSVIKTVLALEHRTIPPQIKCFPPNPAISARLTVPTEPTPWPEGRLERASVNSFGVGGSNAHVIIDSAAGWIPPRTSTIATADMKLLLFSANSSRSLTSMVHSYRDFIDATTENFQDIAYTLAHGKQHLLHRAFTVPNQGDFGIVSPPRDPVRLSSVIMVFTGQGAQWPCMGSDLMRSNEPFRSSILSLDKILKSLDGVGPPQWTIEEELIKSGDSSRVHTAEVAQPLCTAVQIALVDAFASLGIVPSAVVGHSSGEIAAAYAAGALTAKEAILTAMYRGIAATSQTRHGAMAAIGMSKKDALNHLANIPNICIACDNSPRSVTISGDVEQVDIAITTIRNAQPDTLMKKVKVDKAYHSHHMLECTKAYLKLMHGQVIGRPPLLPFFSTVTGNILEESYPLDALYWVRNLQSEVRFYPAISSILMSPIASSACFLEIGPHSALQGPLTQISTQLSTPTPYISAMIRDQNSTHTYLSAVGKLFTHHIPIKLEELFPVGSLLPDLPRYPYDHEGKQFWFESRLSREHRQRQYPHHDLLGSKAPESTDSEPLWRNMLHVGYNTSWLRDHKVEADIVFPFAGYIAIAGEAVRQLMATKNGFCMRHVVIKTALVLPEERPTEIVTTFRRVRLTETADSKWFEFTISAHNGHQWIKHCTGEVVAQSEGGNQSVTELPASFPRPVDTKKWFSSLERAGLSLGPAFQNLDDITADTKSSRASGKVFLNTHLNTERYYIHPAQLDSALQLCAVSFTKGQTRKLKNYLPTRCDYLAVSPNLTEFYVEASSYITSNSILVGEARGVVDGHTVLSFSGLRLACLDSSDPREKADTYASARLHWGPDIDYADIGSMLRSTTKLDCSTFLKALAHCKPNLHSLHIEGCGGLPAEDILESLTLPNGHRLYKKCTFASRELVPEKEQLEGLTYSTLDIESDPLEQGFGSNEYDVVLTSRILHGTGIDLQNLKNIHKILRSGGFLVMTEQRSLSTSGEDGMLSWWQDTLREAGYNTLDAVATDGINDIFVVQAQSILPIPPPKRVTLLCQDHPKNPSPIAQALEGRGFAIDLCTVYDNPKPEQDIIAILDQDEPFFTDMNNHSFEAFKDFVRHIKGAGLFWITRSSQIHCPDPRYAQVTGMARTIRSELLIDFATCEVDTTDVSASYIIPVFEKFQTRDHSQAGKFKPEMEFSIQNGVVHVGRFYPFALSENMLESIGGHREVLEVSQPGRLSSLQWTKRPAQRDLQSDDVELEIHATGLNFRDVLVAMKLVEFPKPSFGVEAAGVVRRAGSNVKFLRVGDRVAVEGRYLMSTVVVAKEGECIKIPDDLSFESAASMFVPFCTVIHSLIDVGNLHKGQSVLIHSACGGVGLAALQVAKMVGAEIYATVGRENKVQYLMDNFQLPRNRILHSRDDSFVQGIMRETNNRGVDLVLNSLATDLLHATWRCVAPFGKMIEIGKGDLQQFGKLDMNPFLLNRSYCGVDLDTFVDEKPYLMIRLKARTMDFLRLGLITPLPTTIFDAHSAYDALKYMQGGQHIGRICISMRDTETNLKLPTEISLPQKVLELQPNASYLFVGGLGGLGRAVSTWMIEHGARHLIYLSRSAGTTPDDHAFAKELESMGCEVQLIRGSITEPIDVTNAVRSARHPLRGVLQMSMVLEDESFFNMTFDQWNIAASPKIQGTWNLHHATKDCNLDFFGLFSSVSGLIGQPGQANYATGNAFLDAFVKFRVDNGLPAFAIDIGPVSDVGYLVDHEDLFQKASTTGFKALVEQEVLDALLVAMTTDSGLAAQDHAVGTALQYVDRNTFVLGLGSSIPLDHPSNRAVWRSDPRFAIYHNQTSDSSPSSASDDSLKAFLLEAKADTSLLSTSEAARFLAHEIGKRLFILLMKPEESLNLSSSLADLGMDSLVGIELRAWWIKAFGFDTSVLEMLGMGSLEALGQHAAKGLLHKFATT